MKIAINLWVAGIGLLVSTGGLHAEAVSKNIAVAELSAIAASHEWHRLLHYDKKSWLPGIESQVDDADFFLAEQGKFDAEAELVATIDGFYQPLDADPNEHPMCRFPARWHYLSRKLKLPEPALQITACEEYRFWFDSINPDSVTLVFASSYLNSPSSMYGHTLLRIDPPDIESGSKWLSYAVNFGAEVTEGDNSILYAYKGLFGGYPGFFTIVPYYQKIKDYNRIENRDIWEYNLNLTPDESTRLVRHLWELRNVDFAYYFFDENCSYRLLELLEVARGSVSLREGFGVRAIPIDTVRAVLDADLVQSVEFRPSEALKIETLSAALSPELLELAVSIGAEEAPPDSADLRSLSQEQRALVLRVAYQHLRYKNNNRTLSKSQGALSLQLLSQLSALPNVSVEPEQPTYSPDQGHRTLLVGVAAGSADDNGFMDLRLRASYHDLQDNTRGYLPGAAINIGDMMLRRWEGEAVQLEYLNMVSIESHSERSLLFDPLTWRVQFGWDRIYSQTDDDLTTQLSGGAGLTYGLTENSRYYFMAVSRFEYNELVDQNWNLGVGGLAGILAHFDWATLSLESNYYEFSSGNPRYESTAILNVPWSMNHALRVSAAHRRELDVTWDEWKLEYRYFF